MDIVMGRARASPRPGKDASNRGIRPARTPHREVPARARPREQRSKGGAGDNSRSEISAPAP
jgi:hypothetical protein